MEDALAVEDHLDVAAGALDVQRIQRVAGQRAGRRVEDEAVPDDARTARQSLDIASYASGYIWTGAVGATNSSITVSVASAGGQYYGYHLGLYRNHGGVGNSVVGHASSTAPSSAITVSAGSALYMGIA
ncbi:MAG: hypothetical protein ABIX46_08715, partial [Burkholderiaceae bacterium]